MSGPISSATTWSQAGSPYIVDGDVTVDGGVQAVLTIEPGVLVKFADGRALAVGVWNPGEIRAAGTVEKPIVFTTAGAVVPGKWKGLLFASRSGSSRLENVVIEGAGWSATAGIRVAGSAPVLKGVTVRATNHRGISVEAGGAPEISGCTVSGTTGGDGTGVYVAAGARATIADTVIGGSANGAITAEPGAGLSGLTGMVLTGNGQDGVRHRGGVYETSETWRGFGYPHYVIDGGVGVHGWAAPVLTMEPGVVVKVGDGGGFSIGQWDRGALRAVGTAEKPIVFTTAGAVAPGKWQGLLIALGSGSSRLENVVVEGAGSSATAGIRVAGSAPVLKGVMIRATNHRGVSVEAGGAPEIDGCTVSGTTGGDGTGVYVAAGARATITDTVIGGSANGAITAEPGAGLNGLTGMVLTGNGQDGVRHRGGVYETSETWRGFGYPHYVIDGGVGVHGWTAPVLTIEPGVVVKVGDGGGFSIGQWDRGALQAVGTAEKPIVFTTAGAVAPGKWQGLLIASGSGSSRLENVVVEGAGSSATAGIRVEGAAPVLKGVTVRATRHRGISVEAGGAPEISGCTVSATTGGDGTGVHLASGSAARLDRVSVSGSSGSGVVNDGSGSRLRRVSISASGAEGLRNSSGELTLRDGSVLGQAVPVRNSDTTSRTVDARQQWWGSANGPTGLVGRVESDPWLGAPATSDFTVTSLVPSSRAFAPVVSSVRFDLGLPSTGRWALSVLAADGSEAKRWDGTGRSAFVNWDGTNTAGTALPDGAVTYRLEAADESTGRAAAPLVGRIEIDGSLPVAILASPAGAVRVRAGDDVPISGTAGGPGFQSYLLEAGAGDFPAAWTTVDRGILAVAAGRLGNWTTALAPAGWYTLRLSVTSASGKTAVARARIELVDEGACR